jgi:hypothetical protein
MSDTDSEYASNREPEPDRRTIDAHVNEYFQIGDDCGLNYDSHCYSIHVRVENLFYTIDRTYVDFVELDRRLRKKFPRSNIFPLPLEAAESIERALNDKDREQKRKSLLESGISLASARDVLLLGLEATTSPLNILSNSFRVKEKIDEDFGEKVTALDTYLAALLTHPEVVASDDIILFLDEEASSMNVDPNSLLPLSEHDLLLINVQAAKATVRRVEEKSFPICAGQYIVWRFSTLNFDIGFSIELNGETKIPYTRHKSHEKAVFGTLEASNNGICKLKWDNTYARCKSYVHIM